MLSLATFCCGLALAALTDAQISLGRAAPFGIVATTAITSTGATIVDGQLGIFPNDETSITGFPPGISGPVFGGDATAQAARDDATSAYTALAALTPTTFLTGQDLGGMTLFAGVYNFASSGGLTGVLTLDGQGNSNALFVFQFGSTLTTASASSVVLINGAQACNVFWQVGSSATLGTTTNFAGNILASASITGNAGVTVQGGLYALTAAVTLIEDTITAQGSCGAPVPESSTTASPTTLTMMTSTAAYTTTPASTVTITSTVIVTESASPASTVTVTASGTVATTTVTDTVATSYTKCTSTTTKTSTMSTTKTAKAPQCTSTAKAAAKDKRAQQATETVTVTSTKKDGGRPTSTVTKGKAMSTKTVKTTHTSTTSTYWTTKTTSMTYTATMTPKCTTKAAAVRRYQRM
ncbi:hypothetical protein H2199_008828 [Coniosporium tulheliwenetii]|uniref:Uncharacterized protein n=1 Tax=Coniosporium tulheliwenetii TaxID=3383036 RepID=A0ACC2YHG7_9PEZI|nr:hypothetical protein H2199_008828 [Cladosporium sp. JES 115]